MTQLKALIDLFTFRSEEEKTSVEGARPFFIVVILLVLGSFVYAVFFRPEPLATVEIVFLGGLIALHGFLHWHTPLFEFRPHSRLPFLLVQGVLAFPIAVLIHEPAILLILYSILLGEAVGISKEIRERIIAIFVLLALAGASGIIISGFDIFAGQSLIMVPVTLFILVYVILFNRQSEANRRAQALLLELEVAHKQLAEYTMQAEELARSAERERIARDLHDTLSQGLAGIILQMEAAISHLEEKHPDRTHEILDQALKRARQALSEARQTIDTLRHESISGDLRAMIQTEANRFTDITTIPCKQEIGALDNLPPETHQHILRIVTESLSNITRHAQAHTVSIVANCKADTFLLELSDDGTGFQPEGISTGHYGLIGMRERVRLIGGKLSIESAVGKGTTVQVTLPLEEGS